MHLVLHAATTGLPAKKEAANESNVSVWNLCRLVKLSYGVYDDKGVKRSGELLVRPHGYTIPNTATKIHGVTTAVATAEGQSCRKVLDKLMSLIAEPECTTLVYHNMDFTRNVLLSELYRANRNADAELLQHWPQSKCTMAMGSALFSPDRPYLRLSNLYKKLFLVDFGGVWGHGPNDVDACAKCFLTLNNLHSTDAKKRKRQECQCTIDVQSRFSCHGTADTCADFGCDWCTCSV